MSKRPSSPTGGGGGSSTATATATHASPSTAKRRQGATATSQPTEQEDDGMGEFEDAFEDEIEDDEENGEVIYHDSDSEAEGGADGMDVDADADGAVDGKITRLDDEPDPADAPPTAVYLPHANKLEEGQSLEPDQSAYEMLHRLNVTWPCLSFDILRDHMGNDRKRFPHEATWVAGTQADRAGNNEIIVMRASAMHRTQKDGNLSDDSDDESDDEDALDDDAVLEYRSIPHIGGVNRVRAAPSSTPTSSLEPCLDAYPVAVWSELGKVSIWDVRPLMNSLSGLGGAATHAGDPRKMKPLHVVEAHRGVEGYALDWAGSAGGSTGRASSLRLLSGDIHSKIFLTTSSASGFTTSPTPFTSHTSSVEDLQWSPSEPTVFASCSADRSVRIWDVRVRTRTSALAITEAHPTDVNVISWNRREDYLLVSGGDEGGLNVWDLRAVRTSAGTKSKPTPVAAFNWHTAPISSVEWHPDEESVFAASGRDDQVTLWDLSVEEDDEEQGATAEKAEEEKDVPPQLLFCHHGASEIKEVHWHAQIPGMLMSTSADGFHLFKTISV